MRTSLVVIAALLAGCVKNPNVEELPAVAGTAAKEFYPLAVGNTWSYHVEMLGQKQEIEVKVLKEDNGVFEDSTGNQLFADAWGVRDQKRYLLRDPVQTGTEWSNVVSVSSVEHYRIVSAGVSCDSPAGQFEGCAVVESSNRIEEGKTLFNELTFAPKVGLIRVSTLLENHGNKLPQSTLVLTRYQVKGAPAAPAATAK